MNRYVYTYVIIWIYFLFRSLFIEEIDDFKMFLVVVTYYKELLKKKNTYLLVIYLKISCITIVSTMILLREIYFILEWISCYPTRGLYEYTHKLYKNLALSVKRYFQSTLQKSCHLDTIILATAFKERYEVCQLMIKSNFFWRKCLIVIPEGGEKVILESTKCRFI